MDLALNILQWSICHKAKLNQTKTKEKPYMHQVARLQFWNSGKYGVHFSCYYSQVQSYSKSYYLFCSNRSV